MADIYDWMTSYDAKVNAYVPCNARLNGWALDVVDRRLLQLDRSKLQNSKEEKTPKKVLSLWPGPWTFEQKLQKRCRDIQMTLVERSENMATISQQNNPNALLVQKEITDFLEWYADENFSWCYIGMSLHEKSKDEKRQVLQKMFDTTVPWWCIVRKDYLTYGIPEVHEKEVKRRFIEGKRILSSLNWYAYDEQEESDFVNKMQNKELTQDHPITPHEMMQLLHEVWYVDVTLDYKESTFGLVSGRKPIV